MSGSSLKQAAKGGDVGKVRTLLQSGAPVNFEYDDYGYTPLNIASCEGHEEVVQVLVDEGVPLSSVFHGEIYAARATLLLPRVISSREYKTNIFRERSKRTSEGAQRNENR